MVQTQKDRFKWLVYIIKCGDGSLYTGITKDIDERLIKHRDGKGAKYTKSRDPFQILFTQFFANRSEATKREIEIKKMPRKTKLQLVHSHPHNQKSDPNPKI